MSDHRSIYSRILLPTATNNRFLGRAEKQGKYIEMLLEYKVSQALAIAVQRFSEPEIVSLHLTALSGKLSSMTMCSDFLHQHAFYCLQHLESESKTY